jgi:predicted PurR-regulated permease PerM
MGGRSLPRRRVGHAVARPRPRAVQAVVCLVALLLGAVSPAALAAKPKSAKPTATTAASTPTATAASTPTISPLPSSSNPLSGGVPLSPVQTTSTTATVIPNVSTAGSGTSSLSSGSALAIVAGALVVLVGISFFIWRDARRRAPVRAANAAAGSEGRRTGSKAPPKPRKLSAAERRRRKRGRARR